MPDASTSDSEAQPPATPTTNFSGRVNLNAQRDVTIGGAAFTEDDADRFFGRETLVNELLARVKDSRFVVIAGPSDSGKSSLVRAGLIHALKQGAMPNRDRGLYATHMPGRDPIEPLALAVIRRI